MTENYYDVLLGYANELCDGEGARLYNLKEVADFIHVMGGGYITEDDGTPLLEIKERDFVFCNDVHYKYALMAELRKGEGFEDRNWL
jgi:hypothetical protein